MNIIALDLGTKTGFATSVRGDISHGVIQLSKGQNRFEGGGARYLRFETVLRKMLSENSFAALYFEAVNRHKGVAAAHVYGGLSAILMAECERIGLPYIGVGVGTVKKFWCNHGGASKLMMIAEAKNRGFSPKDDNAADALAILHYGLNDMKMEY